MVDLRKLNRIGKKIGKTFIGKYAITGKHDLTIKEKSQIDRIVNNQ